MTLLYLPDTVAVGSQSLAMNCQGDRVLVGTPASSNGENNAGAAYVLDAITGNLMTSLQPLCLQHQDRFGSSVAMNCDGSRALVGAKRSKDTDQSVTSPGVVYLFDIIDNTNGGNQEVTATLLQTFHNPNPQDYDEFGIVVAIDQAGETIAIASPNHNHNQGIVYIYNKNGTLIRSVGPPSILLTNNNTNNMMVRQPRNANNNTEHNLHRDQFFGSSLALSGDSKQLLVGAPGKGWTKQLPGAAYLFDTYTGELLQTIHNPAHNHSQAGDATDDTLDGSAQNENEYYFASAVAMSSNASTLVVGAMRQSGYTINDHQESDSGMVHVFNQNGRLLQTLTSPNNNYNHTSSAVNDHFGISVSITHDGDHVLVGAPHSNPTSDDTSATSSPAGIAFLFETSSGNLKRSMYNPIQVYAAGSNQPSNTQSSPAIQFGGTVALASYGKYAAVSSAFHPVVDIACLQLSCRTEQGPSELIAISERKPGAMPLLAYDDEMCLVPSSAIDKKSAQQLGGSRKSKLSVLTVFLALFCLAMIVCLLIILRKSRKKTGNQHRSSQQNQGSSSENNLAPASTQSWGNLPEIL